MHAFTQKLAAVSVVLAVAGAAAATTTAQAATDQLGPPPPSAPEAKPDGLVAPAVNDARSQRQAALLPIARRLSQAAEAAGSALAGVSIDADAGILHVYTTEPRQRPNLGSRLPAGLRLMVHRAAFTHRQLTAVLDRVHDDARLPGAVPGIEIAGYGVDEDGSGISVTIVTDAAHRAAADRRATRILRARYGSAVGDVRTTTTRPSADDLFFAGSRFNDYAPWYSADRLTVGCTTGVSALYNAKPVMLTAAHCGTVGTPMYNGPRTAGTSTLMGSVVASEPNTDIASIQVASTSTKINVGADPQVPSLLTLGAWSSPVVGQYVCQSGSYTGERCNLKVVAKNQYQCRSQAWWGCSAYVGPLADGINTAGPSAPAGGHGDSGAPVYVRSGATAIPVGIVHGRMSAGTALAYGAYYPESLSCPAPEGWMQRCASGFSFAHLPGF